MSINYERALKEFQERLDFEIEKNSNPRFLIYLMVGYKNGQLKDEDIKEERGWRNAMKYMREILQGIISEAEEQS